MLAKIAVTLAVTVGAGWLAGDALGASLSVQVSPARLHPGARYTITFSGRYNRNRRRAPYLLAFIQYNGNACRSSAIAEYSLPTSDWSWAFYPQRAETSTQFRTFAYWRAGPTLGYRRVCAYLYPAEVTPSTTAKPIVLASASFRNVRR